MANERNGGAPETDDRERDDEAGEAARLRKRVEELEAVATSYDALFRLAAVGISQADAGTGRILDVNPKLARMLGYAPDELRGHTYLDITYPPDRDLNRHEFARLLAGEIPEMALEKRYVRKDGSVFRAQVCSSIIRDGQGRPLRAVGIIQDVSERHEAEAALRESEQRLRVITETVQDVFWLSTPGVGRMLYVSPAYERIWGRSCESLYQRPQSFIEAVHPDDRERLVAGLKGHAEGRWAFEYRILRPDGEARWIRDQGYAIRGDDGSVCAMTGIASDITELKRALLRQEELSLALRHRGDELERINRDLEQFTYAATHDLKAPLRAVDNLAGWIEEDLGDALPPEVREHLSLMHRRIHHMQRLLEDLMAYARAGQAAGAVERVDLGALLAEQLATLPIPKSFHVHLPPRPPSLETAPVLLGQVIANLLTNAIRHHDRQDGNLWIGIDDLDGHYRIRVEDDGPGIPPEQRERVFGMFVSLDRKHGGSGIGLPMVKKIVERVGGELSLAERPGGGCVFAFTWPKVLQCV